MHCNDIATKHVQWVETPNLGQMFSKGFGNLWSSNSGFQIFGVKVEGCLFFSSLVNELGRAVQSLQPGQCRLYHAEHLVLYLKYAQYQKREIICF